MSEETNDEAEWLDPPSAQITRNCHYISRFLTRPWEGQRRRLHFFDFATGEFEDGPSRRLFAEHVMNSQAVESWLGRMVEQPLGVVRPRLAALDPTALDDWRFYRAAVLMVWLQGLRLRSIADESARRDLSDLASQSDAEADSIVASVREEFDLCVVYTVWQGTKIAPLYFPSSGVFPFVYPDSGCLSGHAIALGLPLEPHCALAVVPADKHGTRDLSRIPSSISNFSIGTSTAGRLVVPPTIFEAYAEDELRTILLDMRRDGDGLREAVKAGRQIVIDAFASVGLAPDADRCGRLSKPR